MGLVEVFFSGRGWIGCARDGVGLGWGEGGLGLAVWSVGGGDS